MIRNIYINVFGIIKVLAKLPQILSEWSTKKEKEMLNALFLEEIKNGYLPLINLKTPQFWPFVDPSLNRTYF